jgi:hypothetical protein
MRSGPVHCHHRHNHLQAANPEADDRNISYSVSSLAMSKILQSATGSAGRCGKCTALPT